MTLVLSINVIVSIVDTNFSQDILRYMTVDTCCHSYSIKLITLLMISPVDNFVKNNLNAL